MVNPGANIMVTPPSAAGPQSPNKDPHLAKPFEQPGVGRGDERNSNPRSGSQGGSQGRSQPNPSFPPPRDERDYHYNRGVPPPPNAYMPPGYYPSYPPPSGSGGFPPNMGYPPGYYNYPPSARYPVYPPPAGHPLNYYPRHNAPPHYPPASN